MSLEHLLLSWYPTLSLSSADSVSLSEAGWGVIPFALETLEFGPGSKDSFALEYGPNFTGMSTNPGTLQRNDPMAPTST